MTLGIFGGTFDPFTIAHFQIVEEVLKQKKVDKVIILPTIVSYYRKNAALFSYEDRLSIIRKWAKGFSRPNDVIIDTSELQLAACKGKLDDVTDEKLAGRRYWNSLDELMTRYGHQHKYVTIVGEDELHMFKTWANWQFVIQNSTLLAVKRGEIPASESISDLPISWCQIPDDCKLVSSTDIRKALKFDSLVADDLQSEVTAAVNIKETYLTYVKRQLKKVAEQKLADASRHLPTTANEPISLMTPDTPKSSESLVRDSRIDSRVDLSVTCEFPCSTCKHRVYDLQATIHRNSTSWGCSRHCDRPTPDMFQGHGCKEYEKGDSWTFWP